MTHRSAHIVRVGSIYRPNNSPWAFFVEAIFGDYAHVRRLDWTHPRCILLDHLRPSTAKHGYTLLEVGPEVEA